MGPENHPFGKEKHLLKPSFLGLPCEFSGVCQFPPKKKKQNQWRGAKESNEETPTKLRPLESSNRIEAHSHFLNLMRTQGAEGSRPRGIKQEQAQGVRSENFKHTLLRNHLGMECKKFPVFFCNSSGLIDGISRYGTISAIHSQEIISSFIDSTFLERLVTARVFGGICRVFDRYPSDGSRSYAKMVTSLENSDRNTNYHPT